MAAALNNTGILLLLLLSLQMDTTFQWNNKQDTQVLLVLFGSAFGYILGKQWQKLGVVEPADDGEAICEQSTSDNDVTQLDKFVINGTFKRNFKVISETGQFLLVEHMLENKRYRLV
ncbi:MAG: hypothetical protein V2I33_19750, partial [Kangiellaceae bacterium]|nr:hypothetical protein [Kangiellaceae bacterium]